MRFSKFTKQTTYIGVFGTVVLGVAIAVNNVYFWGALFVIMVILVFFFERDGKVLDEIERTIKKSDQKIREGRQIYDKSVATDIELKKWLIEYDNWNNKLIKWSNLKLTNADIELLNNPLQIPIPNDGYNQKHNEMKHELKIKLNRLSEIYDKYDKF